MKIGKQKSNRKILIIAFLILACVGALAFYYYKNSQSSSGQKSAPQTKEAIDSSAEERVKNGGGSGQSENTNPNGGVRDTGGEDAAVQSNGISSQSGNITLYSPVAGQYISTGVTVEGAAKTSIVFYRIKDNLRGVIGSGSLSVQNGLFSGQLSVSTTATGGSFEVYSLDSTGKEADNISVKLRY